MAYADYMHCAVCDAKAFYDAGVDWESANVAHDGCGPDPAGLKVLCEDCAKTHEVVVRSKAETAPLTLGLLGVRSPPSESGDCIQESLAHNAAFWEAVRFFPTFTRDVLYSEAFGDEEVIWGDGQGNDVPIAEGYRASNGVFDVQYGRFRFIGSDAEELRRLGKHGRSVSNRETWEDDSDDINF